jgi:hypothetical protein
MSMTCSFALKHWNSTGNDMTTITRIRTDWINRYHVQADADASVLDCLVVELPPYTTEQGVAIGLREGMSMDDLLQEALTTLDRLRKERWQPVLPASAFVPFGVITARNFEEVSRETELRTLEIVGADAGHPNHDERVRALCRMADLLEMTGPLPPQQFGTFPPVRH